MNQTDPIADLLTRIRNANTALKAETSIPYSRLKGEVVKVLKRMAFGYRDDEYFFLKIMDAYPGFAG